MAIVRDHDRQRKHTHNLIRATNKKLGIDTGEPTYTDEDSEMMVAGNLTINQKLPPAPPPKEPNILAKALPYIAMAGLGLGGAAALPSIIKAFTPEVPAKTSSEAGDKDTDTFESIRLNPDS